MENRRMNNKNELWTKNFILITLVNLLLFMSFQLFPSALPPYIKSLGAPDSALGWITGITTIATLLIRPFTGIALDKFGRKGIFLTGLAAMLISAAAYRFSQAIGIILAVRFFHGVAWGAANTACNTVAADNIVKERFGEGMGFFSLSGSLALALAPALSLSVGMRAVVWLALGFSAVSLILALSVRYERMEALGGGAPKRRTPYEKAAIPASAIVFLIMTGHGAVLTFLALYGKQRGVDGAGLFFTVYAVCMLLSRPFLGKLVDRFGFGAGIWPSIALLPISLLLLSVSDTLPLFLLSAAPFGVGMGAAQTSLQTMAVVNAPKNRTGAANATFFTGFDGGIGFGAIVSGWIAAAVGYGGMFAVVAAFPVAAGALYFVVSKRKNC